MDFLDSLEPGEHATIVNFETEKLPLKLIEMGCLPGNKVCLFQKAPFNCPLYLEIDGCHLAIRKDVAALIEIERY